MNSPAESSGIIFLNTLIFFFVSASSSMITWSSALRNLRKLNPISIRYYPGTLSTNNVASWVHGTLTLEMAGQEQYPSKTAS